MFHVLAYFRYRMKVLSLQEVVVAAYVGIEGCGGVVVVLGVFVDHDLGMGLDLC